MSRGRKDGAVILGGDAAEDGEQMYEALLTLIAIGTHTGKVLVFNVLGLLVHEIDTRSPVVAVDWVGDMSAPSNLPTRKPLLSPESRPIVDHLMKVIDYSSEDLSRIDDIAESSKNQTRPHGASVDIAQSRIDRTQESHTTPLQRQLAVSKGSPLQIKRTRVHQWRKASARPRIGDETFQALAESPESPIAADTNYTPVSSAPVKKIHQASQAHKAPAVLTPYTTQDNGLTQASLPSSSNRSEVSDQGFTTPPSTKEGMFRVSRRLSSPRAFIAAMQAPPALAESSSALLPSAANDSIRPEYDTVSPPEQRQPLVDRKDSSSWQSRFTNMVYRVPQRQATVEARETPSSIDVVPVSPPRRAMDVSRLALEDDFLGIAEFEPGKARGIATSRPQHQGSREASANASPSNVPAGFLSETALHACTAGPAEVHFEGGLENNIDATQHRTMTERSETPPWLRSPASLHSRTSSRMLQTTSREESKTFPASPKAREQHATFNVIDRHVRLESPSSLYSRPTSRMFREARANASKTVTSKDPCSKIPTTIRHADRELSYDGEAHDVVGAMESYSLTKPKRWSMRYIDDDVRKLRDDHEVLRQDMDALRVEVRALRTVLLSS